MYQKYIASIGYARMSELKTIYKLFQVRKDVFPHIRQDGLKRRIDAGQCIYQDGVVITYQQYKKRTTVGGVQIPAGAIMLHQILNSGQFSGAGGEVFEQFVKRIVRPSGGDLYLSVREENTLACQFYQKHGMRIAGKVAWKSGTILGLV